MKIVYQQTKNGETQMELWIGEKRICTFANVENAQAILNMVEVVNSVNALSRLQEPDTW